MDIGDKIRDAYDALKRPKTLAMAGLAAAQILSGGCQKDPTQEELAQAYHDAKNRGEQSRTIEIPHSAYDVTTEFINTDGDPAYDLARTTTPDGFHYGMREITDGEIDIYIEDSPAVRGD